MQLAIVIHMKGRIKISGVFHRSGIDMHAASIMISLKSNRRAAFATEMPIDAV